MSEDQKDVPEAERDSELPEPLDAAEESAGGPEGSEEGSKDPIPREALFSPDEPIARPEGYIPGHALFSPDDPVRQDDSGEGIVTNLGGREIKNAAEARSLLWEVRVAADLMETLARDLREEGLGALKLNPGAEPLDVMIRSFVAGYLIGKLDEEG